jgi:hypothetical protein
MNRFRSLNRLRPGPAALLAVLLAVPITGCGPGRGEVSGTVRYNGKPLPLGTIQFLGQDGIPHAAPIQSDGTYTVSVPAGEAKVIVSCMDEYRLNQFTAQLAAGRSRATPPPASNKSFSLIPSRYTDWNASGLTALVERGKSVHDFNLTPK